MNERIKELAEQSGATVITTHGMEDVVDGCYVIGPARLEKFAELIVQECIKVVDDTMTENQEMNIGLVMASAAIIAHFGVEE